MPVDFKKLRAKSVASGKIPASYKVVDSVALKKSWAKKPGYWVEILLDETDGLFVIKKSWSWWNKNEATQVEGDHTSAPSSLVGAVRDQFLTTVQQQLDRDYVVSSRRIGGLSPARDDKFSDGVVQETVKAADQVVKPALRRKPRFDI